MTTRLQEAEDEAKMERVRAVAKLSAVLVAFILLVAYGPKVIVGAGHQVRSSHRHTRQAFGLPICVETVGGRLEHVASSQHPDAETHRRFPIASDGSCAVRRRVAPFTVV